MQIPSFSQKFSSVCIFKLLGVIRNKGKGHTKSVKYVIPNKIDTFNFNDGGIGICFCPLGKIVYSDNSKFKAF